jgi:hypothetical protein
MNKPRRLPKQRRNVPCCPLCRKPFTIQPGYIMAVGTCAKCGTGTILMIQPPKG